MIKNVLLQDLTLARSNLQKFNVANEELGRDAVARHLSKGSSSEEETT